MRLTISSHSYTAGSKHALIDYLHSAFDDRKRHPELHEVDGDPQYVAKLLVHEWVANLVQHADFRDTEAEIDLQFHWTDGRLRYVIHDNSAGFDLARCLRRQLRNCEPFPERGMGLLMLNACANEVNYCRTDQGRNRLEFVLSSETPGPLNLGPDDAARY